MMSAVLCEAGITSRKILSALVPGSETSIQVPIGTGKSLLSLLAPLYVPDCRSAICFITPPEVKHYQIQAEKLLESGIRTSSMIFSDGASYINPGAPAISVMSTAYLSKPGGDLILKSLSPDLILVTEGNFAPNTARGQHLSNYLMTTANKPTIITWT